MYALVRPLLFAVPPSWAHGLAMTALGPVEHVGAMRSACHAMFALDLPSLATRAMGIDFPNPIGLAAGFDKNARRAHALASIGFGHLELGTVTALAQEANPAPNLFRLPADRALVNRLGFPNEGAERVVARIDRASIGVPVGISIGKSRAVGVEPIEGAVDDYMTSFRLARPRADFVVVNVSSPNTKDLRAMQGAELARVLLSAIAAEKGDTPLLVKIAPDLSDADLEALLAVVEEVGLDGVVATNTTIERASLGLATESHVVDAIGAGGLSGAPLHTRSLAVVKRVRARLGPKPTVIGVGGVETPEQAIAMMRAGANLVQLYTGFIYGGPGVVKRMLRGLAAEVRRTGVATVSELVGAGI